MSKAKGNGKANGKSSGNNAGNNEVGMATPSHGRGALKTGGTPGNKGGGRQPSAIREACRAAFAKRLPVLVEIAANEEARDLDRIAAMSALGKYGGVDKLALSVEELPEQAMTPERIADLFETVQRIKTVAQLEKLLTGVVKKQVAG